MFSEIRKLKYLIRVAVLAVFALVAACGGGGDGGGAEEASPSSGDDSSGPGVVACIILTLATGQVACDSSGSSSPPSSPPPSSTPPPSSAGAALVIRHNKEFEPNDDLANANLPSYPTRNSPDQKIGWFVEGSIDDVSDITDTYAFTPSQTHEYYLSLCPPEGSLCDGNSRIDTLTAFFRVLDQDGTVLYTSEAVADDGNAYFMTLAAGVLYYVTVDAGDTMGVTVDYRLYVYESS